MTELDAKRAVASANILECAQRRVSCPKLVDKKILFRIPWKNARVDWKSSRNFRGVGGRGREDLRHHVPDCSSGDENVKSIPLNTENWLRKLYDENDDNDKTFEDKHETNHINNKCNDMNMNTRKMQIT